MSGRTFLPPGRPITAVAPRHDALAVIAERVQVRRRRKRARAVAALAVALVTAAPLLLAARDTTQGLEPARPVRPPTPTTRPAADDPPGISIARTPAAGGTTAPVATETTTTVPPACRCGVPAEDDPTPSGSLTVTGSRSGYGVLRVDRPTTVDLAGATVDFLGGEYGGFAVDDAVVFWSTRLDDDVAATPAYRSATSMTLQPGRHRVYLFTKNGTSATATVPWTGRSSETVHADVAVPTEYLPSAGPTSDGGATGFSIDTGTASTVTVVAATFNPAPTGVTLVGCVERSADPCVVRRVVAHATGPTVRLGDRLAGRWPGLGYSVTVRSDVQYASPGVFRVVVFRYDRS